MDLRELLGDAYAEDMTLEQIQEALKDRKLVDVETLPKSVDKTQFDKVASELAAARRELKKIEDQSLTEEQRLKQEMEAKATEIVELRRDLMRGSAREKLAKAGVPNVNFLDDLLGDFNVEDPKRFDSAVDSIVETITQMATAREKQVREELMKKTPTPPAPEGDDVLAAFKGMTVTQKMELKAKNRDEYDRLDALAK